MDGEEKMMMKARGKTTICEDDKKIHISDLPDDILCHILSFLDTKYAVQTSVVSKNFRNLWYRVPVLNFNCDHFRKLSCFDKFVNQVLTVRDPLEIKSFNFSHIGFASKRLYKKVLKYIVAHKVEDLNINVDSKRYIRTCLYSSETVKKFQFRAIHWPNVKIGSLFCSRQLTMIDLQYIAINEPEPFSVCPELVNLTLTYCELKLGRSNTFSIVAPKLAKLVLYFQWPMPAKVMVSTPTLNSFYYKGSHPPPLSTSHEFSHLDAVGIDVNEYEDYFMTEEEQKQVTSDLINMLRSFGKAKTFTLSAGAFKVLTRCPSLLEQESSSFIHGIGEKLSHNCPTALKAIFQNGS